MNHKLLYELHAMNYELRASSYVMNQEIEATTVVCLYDAELHCTLIEISLLSDLLLADNSTV